MISEEIRAELTRSGLNLIQQAISIFDADLRLAVANRPFQAMFAFPDALIAAGTPFEEIIRFQVDRGEYGPQTDPESAVRARVEQARTFQPHYMERTRPNGRTISIEGHPLSAGGWVTVYTDITEIKRQESLLRARSEELSEQVLAHAERLSAANRELASTISALQEAKRIVTEAEARTRHVTEMVPAHIAHIDATYHYTFSNRQLRGVMPSAPTEVVGLTVPEVLGDEFFAGARPYLDRTLAGTPQVFEITHPPTSRRIRIALTPDPDSHGMYVLSTDVTAEVQAREALTHAAKRQLAAQMTSGLAHDFGNLLTVILGLQGRLARADLPSEAADQVQATLAAARRGGKLLERIGAITGTRELTAQPVDLPALLVDLAAMARPSLGKGIRLHLRCEGFDLPVLLDPGTLQDSLLNLILNARHALGSAGDITLTARPSNEWIELMVEDTGPGFTPEALQRGLEPFFTTKGGQGSGLGLSMVYDQTKLAGGTLHIDNNRAGGGARVRMRLPLREVAQVSPMMVLLVEDDTDIRSHVRDMLTGLGHSVLECDSLSEARGLADLPGLGLVLSDIQLGDGSGPALLTDISVKGALMTSLPQGHPLRDTGFPVLTKPFDSAALAGFLAEITHD